MSKILFPEREVNSRKKILKILKSSQMGSVVNNIKEKREVVDQFKRYSPGGISKDEARKILGKFHYNKKDSLNPKETAGLAKALGISGSHKYQRPTESPSAKILRERQEKRLVNNSSKTNFSSSGTKSRGFSKMSTLH